MLDFPKNTHASPDDFNAPGSAPLPDAPGRPAVADGEEFISMRGAAWAEYHLLLGDSSSHATRIEREIRSFGGAPTMAILLARWCAEEQSVAHVRVQLFLTLGRDPNARLLRRELEAWAARLPNLRLHLQEDAAAPEVAYRILMWPRQAASTWDGPPQVLQCGEIEWRYEAQRGPLPLVLAGNAAAGDDVRRAASLWALLEGGRDEFEQKLQGFNKHDPARNERTRKLFLAAQKCWNAKPVLDRILCNLSWREVEAAAAAQAEAEAGEKA